MTDNNQSDQPRPLDVPTQQDAPDDFDFVELYATQNPVEIEMLIDVLQDHDIRCFVRNMETAQFPVSVGMEGELRIAVDNGAVEQARSLVEQTIAESPDGGDDEGRFLIDDA